MCLLDNIYLRLFGIGHFQSIKTAILLNFSLITGVTADFLSPMVFSNQYIAGKLISEFYLVNSLLLSIKFNTKP